MLRKHRCLCVPMIALMTLGLAGPALADANSDQYQGVPDDIQTRSPAPGKDGSGEKVTYPPKTTSSITTSGGFTTNTTWTATSIWRTFVTVARVEFQTMALHE